MPNQITHRKLNLSFADLRVLDGELALRRGGYPHTKEDSRREVYVGLQETIAPCVADPLPSFSRLITVLSAGGMGDGCNPCLGS
jgi:hypothetical protein